MLRFGKIGGAVGTGSLSNGHAPSGMELYAPTIKKGRFQNDRADATDKICWAALATSSATQIRSLPLRGL